MRFDLYRCRPGGLKTIAIAVSLSSALLTASGAAALPGRFDMGVYDPAANQAGRGQEHSRLDPRTAMEKTRATGARFVRIPINWNRVACSTTSTPCRQSDRPNNPKNPDDPQYDWSRGSGATGGWYDYEAEVREAFDAGLEPVLSVFFAPAYAECNGQGTRGTDGRLHCGDHVRDDEANYKPNASDYADFMTAVSRKWPGVRHFQIWNEPNYSRFLSPGRSQATVDRYRAMVNAAYGAIKAENPNDFVIAGGTSPNPRTGGPILAFSAKDFLQRLVRSRVNFDAYDTHPYTSGGPWTRPPSGLGAIWISNLDDLGRILRRAKADGKVKRAARFWVSEFGWDSAPADCRRGERVIDGRTYIVRAVPMSLLTRWVSETAYRMWRQGVSVMIWAQLKDYPVDKSPHQGGLFFWGGNDRTGSAKPTLTSFSFPFVAYKRRGGAYVWGRLPSSRSGEAVIERRVRGTWKRVARIETSTNGGLMQKRLHFSLRGVDALRARSGGRHSAAFRLKAPRVPAGIVPFGCSPTDIR